jgi:hypothetical protein
MGNVGIGLIGAEISHMVTWSHGHMVTWSLGHLVTWSHGHLVTWSLGIRPCDHPTKRLTTSD